MAPQNRVTQSQLQSNHKLLCIEVIPPDDTVQAWDGSLGAVLPNADFFVTTPNASFIPQPPSLGYHRVRARADGHYYEDDPVQWPQPRDDQYPHLPFVEANPMNDRHPHAMLWWTPKLSDFICTHNTGTLAPEPLAELQRLHSELLVQVQEFERSSKYTQKVAEVVSSYLVPLSSAMLRLKALPVSFRQLAFLVAETQRYILETDAIIKYMTIYRSRFLDSSYKANVVANVVGCFVYDITAAEDMYRIGVPVWFIRPFTHFALYRVRVSKCVPFIDPRAALVAAEFENDPWPTIFEGLSTSSRKYEAIHEFSRNFLPASNPFDTVPEAIVDSQIPISRPQSSSSSMAPKRAAGSQSQLAQRTPQSKVRGKKQVASASKSGRAVATATTALPNPSSSSASLMKPAATSKSKQSTHPSREPGSGGRDPYELPSGPEYPQFLSVWRRAVLKSKTGRDKDPEAQSPGFAMPTILALTGPSEDSRKAHFLFRFLVLKDLLLQRAALTIGGGTPVLFRNYDWRTILNASSDNIQTPIRTTPAVPPDTKPRTGRSRKTWNTPGELFCRLTEGIPFRSETFDTTEIQMGSRHTVSLHTLPPLEIIREIGWFATEVNFRTGLLILDMRIMKALGGSTNSEERRDAVSKCFPTSETGDVFTSPNFKAEGISAYDFPDRLPYLKALQTVMEAWQPFAGLFPETFNHFEDCTTTGTSSLSDDEASLVEYYCTSWYVAFGCAPSAPCIFPDEHWKEDKTDKRLDRMQQT